jgi:acetyl/propionyl-CoA carboxylase alpha subunit
MFSTVLIANRGEIALRAIRTLRRLGIKSVAVYADTDRNAAHVSAADIAISLGGERPADSYLRIDKIIAACKKSGAEAVFPGYGFLSESAEFAEACEAAGLVFMGPTPAQIRDFARHGPVGQQRRSVTGGSAARISCDAEDHRRGRRYWTLALFFSGGVDRDL